MRTGLEMYYSDNGEYPPSFEYYPSNTNYDGGRGEFKTQMDDYINVDSFLGAVPKGLTTFIYYGSYTTTPNGGSVGRCPTQPPFSGGQTFAITFDTTNIDIIDSAWLYNTESVSGNTYHFYCMHL